MVEYIDRDALFAKFDRMGLGEHSFVEKVFSDGVRTIIAEMPAADVAPVVHGRWIEYPVAHYFKCSECKYTVPYRKAAVLTPGKRAYNFCPHCGAKMDLEEEHG